MPINFSEDLVPLTDLKVNRGRVVKHTTKAHRRDRKRVRVVRVWRSDRLLKIPAADDGHRNLWSRLF